MRGPFGVNGNGPMRNGLNMSLLLARDWGCVSVLGKPSLLSLPRRIAVSVKLLSQPYQNCALLASRAPIFLKLLS